MVSLRAHGRILCGPLCRLFNIGPKIGPPPGPFFRLSRPKMDLTTGRQSPSLFDKWHGIFYMPSRTGTAGHTRAFDSPVTEHWGKSRHVQFMWDSNRQHIGSESNALPTEPSRLPALAPNFPKSKIFACTFCSPLICDAAVDHQGLYGFSFKH